MVTTTEDDDLPTRDALGTDLVRVRKMLALGYGESMIAKLLGICTNRARHAVIVATGDRQGAPSPDEIAARCAEIQAGWSAEMAQAARRGEPRFSSSAIFADYAERVARRRAKQKAAAAARLAARVETGRVPVFKCVTLAGEVRWSVRVQIGDGPGRRTGIRTCDTREEAEAWGREWLRTEYDRRRQDESCCGVGEAGKAEG